MQWIKGLCLTFLCLGSVPAHSVENDLSIFKTVDVYGEVYAASDESEQVSLYLSAAHPYTNTLTCSAHFAVQVFRHGRRAMRHIAVNEILVFPNQAWGTLSYEIHVALRDSEELGTNQSEPVVLKCTGYDQSDPLPDAFCQGSQAVDGHATTCDLIRRLYGRGRYPVLVKGDYVGSCDCS